MPKESLNEAERLLVQRWADARLLEESMESVRRKYKALFQQIADTVAEKLKLDVNRICLTQSWTDGQFGLGRSSWPIDRWGNPAGFLLGSLKLEVLTAEDSELPWACLWIPKEAKVDFAAARAAVLKVAKRLFPPAEVEAGTDDVLLSLPALSKAELLAAFKDKGDQPFVKLFMDWLDRMAGFVPVLDKVFRECVTKQ